MTRREIEALLEPSFLKFVYDNGSSNGYTCYFHSGKKSLIFVYVAFSNADGWYYKLSNHSLWQRVPSVEDAIRFCEEVVIKHLNEIEQSLIK